MPTALTPVFARAHAHACALLLSTAACSPSSETDGWSAPSPPADAAPDVDAALFFGTDGAAPDACARTVTIAVATGGAPQPFDVVVVADNADGLGFSQAALAKGLQNLLTYVRGRAVRFFLLSTTQYGAASKSAISRQSGQDLVGWSSTVTGAADKNPVTQYAQTCTDVAGKSLTCPTYPGNGDPYDLHGAWTFTMPAPVAAITPAMTSAQIATQQQAIVDAILALGGGGAQEEQPICTLSRYIAQPPSALPRHAAFIVLSDEDDTTPPADCLAAYDYTAVPYTQGPTQVPCTSGCSTYGYQTDAPTMATSLAYSCVPEDDQGHLYPAQGTPHTLWLGVVAACGSSSGSSCTSDQMARAAADCGKGYVAQGCAVTCATGGNSYCGLSRPTDATNLCTQSFQENGNTYSNLADYCARTTPGLASVTWGDCQVYGYKETDAGSQAVYSETEQLTPVVTGAGSTADMIASFKGKADHVFGASGYQVETIQLDPAFSCPMGPGQTYAPTLRTLATSAADVFSICGSYAGALQRTQSFADSIQAEYPLALAAAEAIGGVTVTGASGLVRSLTPGDYAYDRGRGALAATSGVLSPGDVSLNVTIVTQSCVSNTPATTH